jgi:hypothetical protein
MLRSILSLTLARILMDVSATDRHRISSLLGSASSGKLLAFSWIQVLGLNLPLARFCQNHLTAHGTMDELSIDDILFSCPYCAASLQAPARLQGTQRNCRNCGEALTVPPIFHHIIERLWRELQDVRQSGRNFNRPVSVKNFSRSVYHPHRIQLIAHSEPFS